MDKESPVLAHAEEISPEMKAYYANRPLRWRNLAMIIVLNLGWSVCFVIIVPLMQIRLSTLGLNSLELGWLTAINSWLTGFLTMYFSWKSDHTVTRWGRRIPYLFFAAPFVIFTVILFPLISVLWILVLVWLIQAIFRDAEAATIPLLNIDCMPRRLLARMVAPLSIIVGVVGFLGMRYGMRLTEISESLPYFIGAGAVFLTTLVGFGIHEPPVKAMGRKEHFKPWSAMQVTFKDRRTILLVISVALIYSYPAVFATWISLYAYNTLHLSRSAIGNVLSWPMLIAVLVTLPGAWLVDHISPYKLVLAYWLLAGVVVVLLWRAHTMATLILAVCAQALIFPLYTGIDIMVYRKAHPNDIGSVTSTLAFVKFGLCAGLVQGLSGNLIQALGNNYVSGSVFAWLLMAVGLMGLFVYRLLLRSDGPPTVAVADAATPTATPMLE